MAQWFSEYWQYALVLLGVCIVAVIVFYFAGKSRMKYVRSYKAQEDELKRLKALKDKYHPLTAEKLQLGDDMEILEAASLVYQIKFEKSEFPEVEFKKLTDVQKNIYTLDVFVSDKTASVFFDLNDKTLQSRLYEALKMIDFDCAMDEFKAVHDMYDENNDQVSFDRSRLSKLDEIILQQDILRKIKLGAAIYIKRNLDLL